jgi:hypothetical protein
VTPTGKIAAVSHMMEVVELRRCMSGSTHVSRKEGRKGIKEGRKERDQGGRKEGKISRKAGRKGIEEGGIAR